MHMCYIYSGTYKECICKQDQLEKEESDGDNAEIESGGENALIAEKDDGENTEKDNGEKELDAAIKKKTKKRKLVKVRMHIVICVQF